MARQVIRWQAEDGSLHLNKVDADMNDQRTQSDVLYNWLDRANFGLSLEKIEILSREMAREFVIKPRKAPRFSHSPDGYPQLALEEAELISEQDAHGRLVEIMKVHEEVSAERTNLPQADGDDPENRLRSLRLAVEEYLFRAGDDIALKEALRVSYPNSGN